MAAVSPLGDWLEVRLGSFTALRPMYVYVNNENKTHSDKQIYHNSYHNCAHAKRRHHMKLSNVLAH